MKKTLSVIALMLAITIMFSINAYAFAIPSYQDIDGYSWASEAIYRMYRDRIMLGWSSEQFAPEGSVTVAEFATTAYRMAGPSPSGRRCGPGTAGRICSFSPPPSIPTAWWCGRRPWRGARRCLRRATNMI